MEQYLKGKTIYCQMVEQNMTIREFNNGWLELWDYYEPDSMVGRFQITETETDNNDTVYILSDTVL